MRKSIYIGAGGLAAAALVAGVVLHAQRSPDAVLHERWAMLDRYCVGCHNDAELAGGVSLDRLRPENVVADARIWEAAIRKLRLGMMPPREEPQPEPGVRESFVAALESTLDAAADARPYAGGETVHRLNRAEYANAVRDLFGIQIDVAELLPSDGGDFGFDNIASALTTSPLLLDGYVTAAQRISTLAVGDAKVQPTTAEFLIPRNLSQNEHVDGLPLGTRGGRVVRHVFPADGEYKLLGRL